MRRADGLTLAAARSRKALSVAELAEVGELAAQELNRVIHKTARSEADEAVSEHEPDLQGEERADRVTILATDKADAWSRSDKPAQVFQEIHQALVQRGLVHRAPGPRPVLVASRHSPRRRGSGRPGRRGASRRSCARSGDSPDGDSDQGDHHHVGLDHRGLDHHVGLDHPVIEGAGS